MTVDYCTYPACRCPFDRADGDPCFRRFPDDDEEEDSYPVQSIFDFEDEEDSYPEQDD